MAKCGKAEAVQYMHEMRQATGTHLVNPDSMYFGKQGHLRFAREMGHCLNDFNTEGQNEILHGSYSSVYVIGCNLKPLLDAKEWNAEMRKQIKEDK